MPYNGLGQVINEDDLKQYNTWDLMQEMDEQQAVFNKGEWPKIMAVRVDRHTLIHQGPVWDQVIMAQYRDDEHKFFSHVGRVASLMAMGDFTESRQAVSRFLAFMGQQVRSNITPNDVHEITSYVNEVAEQLLCALPQGVWQELTPVLVDPSGVMYKGIWYGPRHG